MSIRPSVIITTRSVVDKLLDTSLNIKTFQNFNFKIMVHLVHCTEFTLFVTESLQIIAKIEDTTLYINEKSKSEYQYFS